MDNKIAIIGMAGRFSEINSLNAFFENLIQGKNSIRKFSKEEMIKSGVSEEIVNRSNYMPFGAMLENVQSFDNDFFGMTPYEATITDPQHRVFLTCAWEVLEDAGYALERENNKIGVFASCSTSGYFENNIMKSEFYNDGDFDYSLFIGKEKDSIATRVSYKMNLRGPSITFQTNCSSSLVGVHYACQSIICEETDMAIAGGVSINVPTKSGYLYEEGSTFSKNGEIRPFDEQASGMVKGNGCGVVLLKKLKKAIEDNDNIYAVISGSAVNNDGENKIGYTAPSIKGQTEVIKDTIKKVTSDISDLKYIETHGTGTYLGDPIEFRALKNTYGVMCKKQDVIIGSVKANIGHLDAAAGIVGLIKSALILKKGIIPKSINFNKPNKQLGMEKTNLKIVTDNNIKLDSNENNLVAISSFGIGGTNSHLILEQYNMNYKKNEEQSYIIPFSAKTNSSLKSLISKTRDYLLENEANIRLEDVAFTLARGREYFECKEYFISRTVSGLISEIEKYLEIGIDSLKRNTMGDCWLNGEKEVLIDQFSEKEVCRISLPTYCFEEKDFWVEPQINLLYTTKSREQKNYQDISNEKKILKIWHDNLLVDVSLMDDFFEIGGDSLTAISIISDINKEFDLSIGINDINKYRTPQQIIDKFIVKVDTIDNENISVIKKNENESKSIFFIHPAGGSTYCYSQMFKNIDFEANAYSIGFPYETIPDDFSVNMLAEVYSKQITNIEPQGDIVLAGYSFGGNVAIKIASILENRGRCISHVFLFDSLPPESYREKMKNPDRLFSIISKYMFNSTEKKVSVNSDRLKIDGSVKEQIRQKKQTGEISESFSDEVVMQMFSNWKKSHDALVNQNLSCIKANLTSYCAKDKMEDSMYELCHMLPYEQYDWQRYTHGNFQSVLVNGDHFSIFTSLRNLELLSKDFNNKLEEIYNK